MSDITNSRAASRVQDKLNDLFESKLTPGKAYIKFQLASNITALLSMDRVEESMIVEADKLTALPGMPKSAIGIMSSRDRVFCVFDMAQLLGLPSNLNNVGQYQIILFQAGLAATSVGFAVGQLQGIQRLSVDNIELPRQDIAAKFNACVSGVIRGDRAIPILELSHILKTLTK